jgi:hypothetical protein
MTPEQFGALSSAEREAVLIAVFARNGVEDLHAEGAFDDAQAPGLNHLLGKRPSRPSSPRVVSAKKVKTVLSRTSVILQTTAIPTLRMTGASSA